MSNDAPMKVVVGNQARVAFPFTPATIRLHIPRNVIGSYLLLDYGCPVYIGRSDSCLRRRLGAHPLLGAVTHVAWEAASSPERAFLIEAFWFHELRSDDRVLNLAHPARPAGSARNCPYCSSGQGERKALLWALRSCASRAHRPRAVQTDTSTGTMPPAIGGSGERKGHHDG